MSGEDTSTAGTDGAVGALALVRLVASREIRTRLRSKAFRIGTVALVAGLLGTVAVMYAVAKPSTSKVGLIRADASLSAPLRAAADAVGQRVSVTEVSDAASGEGMVRDGRLDALVTTTPSSVGVVVNKKIDEKLGSAITVLARQRVLTQRISAAGGDPAAVLAAAADTHVALRTLQPAHAYQSQRLVLGVIVGVLLYVGLVLYGQAVAQGVVEEKTSRVVELLLSTVRPWTLMAGKVAGIGVVGLIQMVIVAGVGLVGALVTHRLSLPPGSAVGILAWSLLWYVLGFFMFALVFAALGALVSRQEDVASATSPVTMVLVIPYVLGISILPTSPDSPLISILSIVPFSAPTLMPMRIAVGSALAWQNVLALGLSVLLIAALIGLTGRIYRNAVLRTGAKVRLVDALRAV